MTADRKRKIAAWMAAVIAGMTLAVTPTAPAAASTPQEQQAAQAVAAERCARMRAEGSIPDKYKNNCEERLAEDLLSGKAGQENWADGLCKWVPDLPLIGNPCDKMLSVMRGIWDDFKAKVNGVVDFVTNPVGTVFKNLASSISDAVKSLIEKIFPALVRISSPDVASSGFVSAYAAGAGLAILVLVVMLGRLFYGASQDEITGEELASSLWRWVPTALLAIMFGPGLGYLLVQLSDSASIGIVHYFTKDMSSLVGKLQAMVVLGEASGIPGGALVGIIIDLVALFGMIGLLGGMLVQLLAIYITGSIMALAFAMMVDPRTRKKALKVPFTWVGLTFTKPLLFFLVGAISRMADSAFTAGSFNENSMRALVSAVVAAMALFILGLAPWSLLKYAPVLPNGSSVRVGRASRSQSGGALGGLANSTMMQLAHQRMASSPARGGGQGVAAGDGDSPGALTGGGPPSGPVQNRQSQGQRQSQQPVSSGQSTVRGRRTNAAPAGSAGSGSPAGQVPTPAAATAATGARAAGTAAVGPVAATGTAGTAGTAASGTGTGRANGLVGTGGAVAGGPAEGGGGPAAGGAATQGVGAATGGAATAALLGVQAVDALKRKGQDTAHRASDIAAED